MCTCRIGNNSNGAFISRVCMSRQQYINAPTIHLMPNYKNIIVWILYKSKKSPCIRHSRLCNFRNDIIIVILMELLLSGNWKP